MLCVVISDKIKVNTQSLLLLLASLSQFISIRFSPVQSSASQVWSTAIEVLDNQKTCSIQSNDSFSLLPRMSINCCINLRWQMCAVRWIISILDFHSRWLYKLMNWLNLMVDGVTKKNENVNQNEKLIGWVGLAWLKNPNQKYVYGERNLYRAWKHIQAAGGSLNPWVVGLLSLFGAAVRDGNSADVMEMKRRICSIVVPLLSSSHPSTHPLPE